jgi:hypothetical protein
MSVTFNYHGRTGNNMFQYAFARLLALKNELPLGTKWEYTDFIDVSYFPTTPQPNNIGKDVVTLVDLYNPKDRLSNKLIGDYRGKKIHCDGFFQNSEYYSTNKDTVKSFFEQPPKDVNKTDICLHLRLGDYAEPSVDSIVHPQWISQCLSLMEYKPGGDRKLFVVVENKEEGYLNHMDIHRPIYVSQNAREDFRFIQRFENLICSPSSFCWWAAFLGHGKNIMTFPSWMRNSTYIKLAYTDGWKPIPGAYLSCKILQYNKKRNPYGNPGDIHTDGREVRI